jgi:hypothetical protein
MLLALMFKPGLLKVPGRMGVPGQRAAPGGTDEAVCQPAAAAMELDKGALEQPPVREEGAGALQQPGEEGAVEGDRALVCPKCEIDIVPGEVHCSACGYEFSTGKEGIGPFSFAYPAVGAAYQPSGKGSPRAVALMLTRGLPVAVLGGPLLYLAHAVVAGLGGVLAGWIISSGKTTLLFMIAAFAGYVAPAILLGYLIARAVDKGALIGKGRSVQAARLVGLLSGFVSFGIYLVVYVLFLGVEGLDSAIDFIKILSQLLAIASMVWLESGKAIVTTPFCEKCEEFMKKVFVGRYPVRREGRLMEILNSRRFEEIRGLAADASTPDKDFTAVVVWCCDRCKDTGFINVATRQVRYRYEKDGTRKEMSQDRLVFSSPLERGDVETFLTVTGTSES